MPGRFSLISGLLLVMALTGCTNASQDDSTKQAVTFALKACLFQVDSNGGAVMRSDGELQRFSLRTPPGSTSSLAGFTAYSSEIDGLAIDAAAAAQIDSNWQPLSQALTEMSFAWAELKSLKQQSSSPFLQTDKRKKLEQAEVVYQSQCNALSERLKLDSE